MGTEIATTEMGSLTLAPNSQASIIITYTRNERDLSDEDFAIVAKIADGPPPEPALATEAQLKALIGSMAGHLDKRKTSLDVGRLNLKIYSRLLGHLPLSTLQRMTEEALATLKWMPEASDLLKIAEGHIAPELKLHGKAKALTGMRRQRLFEETLRNIADRKLSDHELQDLDERTAGVAETRGLIVIRLDGLRQYRCKETVQAYLADLKGIGDLMEDDPPDERDTRASAGSGSGLFGDLAADIVGRAKDGDDE